MKTGWGIASSGNAPLSCLGYWRGILVYFMLFLLFFVSFCCFSLITGFGASATRVCSNIFSKRTCEESCDLFVQLGSESLAWFNNQDTSLSPSLFFPLPSAIYWTPPWAKKLTGDWQVIEVNVGDTEVSQTQTFPSCSLRTSHRAWAWLWSARTSLWHNCFLCSGTHEGKASLLLSPPAPTPSMTLGRSWVLHTCFLN